jgi:hypothetical protein
LELGVRKFHIGTGSLKVSYWNWGVRKFHIGTGGLKVSYWNWGFNSFILELGLPPWTIQDLSKY